MPNPRQRYLYPKTSTLDLIKDQQGRAPFDYDVPSPLSQAISRRLVEQEQAEAKAKDMKLSPLDRAVAGLEAVAMAGSAMFESVQQLPQLLKGEDAYSEAINRRTFTPRYQPEKAKEYVGNALDAMDTLQTEYKVPSIMPELAGFQPLAEAAKRQAMQGVKRGALQAGRTVGTELARGMYGDEGLLAKAIPESMKPLNVIKEKGGNWLGGNIAGGVDRRLASMKTQDRQISPLFLEDWRQDVKNPSTRGLSDEDVAMTERRLNEHDTENAVNQWIERNVGNYVKKEMATPNDPVRLMLEKRAGEIEAQFQVDMNRAQRTRARAEAETDPRRQANMMRQAQREEEQAKLDRDFANEHATHLPKEEYEPDEDALNDLKSKREEAGFAPEGMAKSEPAQRWENLSDEAVDIQFAKNIQKQLAMQEQSKQANLAFDRIFNEIDERYSVEFRKELERRGVTLDDQQFMNIIKSTPITDKANYLGLGDQFKKLRQESFNADRMFSSGLQEIGEENPFVYKLDPETKLYQAHLGGLGIDHVIDVIKQDVAAGRIRPEQLSKLSMDQAVQRTAEFNMEQAKKMRETAIKQTEGFPVHKEYPEEGYKWIELTAPKDNPKRLSEIDTLLNANRQGGEYGVDWLRGANGEKEYFVTKGSGRNTVYMDKFPTEEEAIARGKELSAQNIDVDALRLEREGLTKEAREKILEDALKYEGDTMGHCVGGYCPDVLEGRSRIYSLRDKRGEPHVTVEVNPSTRNAMSPADFYQSNKVPESLLKKISEAETAGYFEDIGSFDDFVKTSPEYHEYLDSMPPSIRQIKGKQNAAPKADYLPYVQDFVKSGEWSDVGDFKNTGLIKQDGKYMTQAEYDDFLLNELQPPPPEGMKAGGAVSISDNPDTMMMELEDQKFAVGGAAIKRVLKIADHAERAAKAQELLVQMATSGQVNAEAQRALLKAQSGARSLPTVLPRATPKTRDEIRAYAQRTADQLNAAQEGKFLRANPTGASKNIAGKSKKQWEMEQGLTHNLQPLGLPLDPIKTANIEDQLNMLKMGISGDTSVSDQMLHQAGQYALQSPSEQQGGSMFGLRKRFNPAAWASNVPVLENLQRDVGEFSKAYGDVPVIGQYNSMGSQGTNFAQHFADANLEAIASHGLTPDQAEQVNKVIKMGNAKSGVHADFPGVEDPAGAYLYFSFFPELRKHFNDIMTKPDYTTKLGLPDGRVILHAITDPELRDMPVLTSGRAQYQLVPGQDPKTLPLSEHSTYTHNLPREPDAPVTQTPFPVPAELEFSDVTEYAKPRYKPSEMTRVMQTASPRQIVDPQHIDEIKQYEDFMRQYTPQSEKKKTGGLIKVKQKAGGGIIRKAIQATGKAAEAAAPITRRLEMSFKDVAKPVPELTEGAQKLKAGQLSREEYEALVNKHKPVTPYSFVPQPATAEDANRALNVSQRTKFGKVQDIAPGTPTGLRLDINAYKDHGVWVNSIHPKDMPTTYNNVSSVTNAEMVMPEEKALEVATREKNKSPFAVIKGGWNPINEEEAVAKAQEYLNHPEWAQVGIDPERHGYYYNRATMEPIIKADEVIQIGPLVLAKNPVTAPKEAFKYARGGEINANDLILTERPL